MTIKAIGLDVYGVILQHGEVNTEFLQLLQTIPNVKLGVLSNALPGEIPNIENKLADWEFVYLYFSGIEMYGKPSLEAYHSFAEKLQVECADLLVVDDMTTNVIGARQAGAKAVLYESNEQIRTELQEYGLLD